MTTTAVSETETVYLLPLGECHKSPTQPRKRGPDKPSDDFVASIRQTGVIQPIIVRLLQAGGWEIVFGHRRHEGSKLAGRDTVPAIVRVMSDEEVFEAQLIENLQREDMHPLDEADGFKRMLDHGHTIQTISDRIGRTPVHVAQRLKLCELGKAGREAFDAEEITLTVALLLARIPAKLQEEALERVIGDVKFGEPPLTAAQAKKEFEANYLLRLDQAPFDITDAALVPKAGPCNTCPKRTGNQMELYPDAARADLCTDPVCHKSKLDAVWQIRKKEAKKGGPAVLEGAAAESALRYGGEWNRLDDEKWVAGKGPQGGGMKKVRTILGKDLPPVTLVRDTNGAIHEIVKTADVNKALKVLEPERRRTDDSGAGAQRREIEKQRRRAAAVNLTMAAAVEKAGKLPVNDLVRLLVTTLVCRAWNDTQVAIIRRRSLGESRSGAEGQLLAHLKTLTTPDGVAGLGLELALRGNAPGNYSPATAVWGTTLKALGVDYAGFERQIAEEARTKQKAKAAKKSKTKKPAKKTKAKA